MARPPERQRERSSFSRRPLREQLKSLFLLHTAERRGNAALIIILLAVCGAYAHQRWFHEPDTRALDPIRAQLDAWLAGRDSVSAPAAEVPELFLFDPNELDRPGWRRLGLSDRQIDGIERWRSKGGRFRTKADLGRMYSLRPAQFEQLRPYIDLPDSLPRKGRAGNGAQERAPVGAGSTDQEPRAAAIGPEGTALRDLRPERGGLRRKLEVNSADTAALIALPGIGPAFARGIVKYRERLGGYHSLDQLAEVYVLKDKPDAVLRLKELLVADTLMIRRIPLNSCTVEELAAHPYVTWKLAKPIVAYRQHHGPFRNVDGLRAIPLIDEALCRKLAPYLTLE
ncbi:MAG: helix-hairpin-helix domain-containing protein [Flavobacteriales bacterium]|jgi:DNA uptake protein ComE-like DNA-binding protein|nr:MAG: helix-hairpin-helix domain-containing protein [Flavobacteriales bacterium]